jgi:transposase
MTTRIALLSDIHGNIAALDAVLVDVRREAPDLIALLGDYVLNGPRPCEVVDRVRELESQGAYVIQGNTDIAAADLDMAAAFPWFDEVPRVNVVAAEWAHDELGDERVARLETVSLDMGGAYKLATDNKASHVTQCVDPFHLVKLANDALDATRREVWNQFRLLEHPKAPWWKHTRWALLKDEADLSDNQLEVLHHLRRHSSALYRGWQLKEAIRDLYRLRWPSHAPEHLGWWLCWAQRCQIPAFVKLAKTVKANRERILAAVELGLSNSKLEGLNSKVRLINHRGYGHHSAAALIAMVYLCCGGITVELPTARALPLSN